MKATILNIGDELLIGQTLNTNAQWMSQKLNEVGVDVLHHISLSDDKEDIISCLKNALQSSHLIFITGGLGPTSDDITKHVLYSFFGGSLIFNEAVYKNIESIYKLRQREVSEDVKSMCYVPDNCLVIENTLGTAPGMLFKQDNKMVVSMPGVPYEMKGMMENYVIPYLKKSCALPVIIHSNILTAGVGETVLSERLKEFEQHKDPRIKLAYLPNVGKVRLRLTIKGENQKELEDVIASAKLEVIHAVGEFIYGYDDDILERQIGQLLLEKNLQLGLAESCTGGYLSHLMTSIPGSSAYFKGSIISYANEVKEAILGVKEDTLKHYGAVSEETVSQMIKGAIDKLGVDVAVAISGVAGPSGGTSEKPVGTVIIGVGDRNHIIVKRMTFTNNRERNIQLSGVLGMVILRKFLLGQVIE